MARFKPHAGRVDLARRPIVTQPVDYSAQPPPPTPEQRQVTRNERYRLEAERAHTAHLVEDRSKTESWDAQDQVTNPAVNTNLVNWTVPVGNVLAVDKIAVVYSNPALQWGGAVGWRIIIDGYRAPYIFNVAGQYNTNSVGSIGEPMNIEPLWIGSGETVAIEIQGTVEAVTVAVRLSGRIYTPATAGTGGE